MARIDSLDVRTRFIAHYHKLEAFGFFVPSVWELDSGHNGVESRTVKTSPCSMKIEG